MSYQAEIILDLSNGQRMSVRYLKLKKAQADYDRARVTIQEHIEDAVVGFDGVFHSTVRADGIISMSLVDKVAYDKAFPPGMG